MKTKCSTVISTKIYPLVFLGDTAIHHWLTEGYEIWKSLYAPLGAINYGFISESTQNIIERIMKDELPALETTSTVVLMLGFTDLRFRLKEKVVFEQIKKIVLLIQERKSGVKILILGILPSADVAEQLKEPIQLANNLIATCENGFTVRFFDMKEKFANPLTGKVIDDLFTKDKANLSAEGYRVWAESMANILEEVM